MHEINANVTSRQIVRSYINRNRDNWHWEELIVELFQSQFGKCIIKHDPIVSKIAINIRSKYPWKKIHYPITSSIDKLADHLIIEINNVVGFIKYTVDDEFESIEEIPPVCSLIDNEAIYTLWRILNKCLIEMDGEADTQYSYKGHFFTAGLRQYQEHYKTIESKNIGCEPAWSQRLAKLLTDSGWLTFSEKSYPNYALSGDKKRQYCDLVVMIDNDKPFWIEIKGSWPVCFEVEDLGVRPYIFNKYTSYLTQNTALDFNKIKQLKLPSAAHVGVLLIVFETPLQSIDTALASLESSIGSGWSRLGPQEWKENRFGTKVRVWLWHRSTTKKEKCQ